jgi:hypothetical protein
MVSFERALILLLVWTLALPAGVAPLGGLGTRQQAPNQQQALPPSPVRLTPPAAIADRDTNKPPTAGQPFTMSFCDPAPTNVNDLCPGGARNPVGGQGPYHFQLDTMGGFPPMGLVLHPNGLLTGVPKAAGTTRFRVCAVDLAGYQNCQPVEITVAPAAKATARKGANPALVIAAVGAGLGVGAIVAAKVAQNLNSGGKCGDAPSIPSSCLGINRPSNCNSLIDQYRTWCTCMGRTFDVSTGSCK